MPTRHRTSASVSTAMISYLDASINIWRIRQNHPAGLLFHPTHKFHLFNGAGTLEPSIHTRKSRPNPLQQYVNDLYVLQDPPLNIENGTRHVSRRSSPLRRFTRLRCCRTRQRRNLHFYTEYQCFSSQELIQMSGLESRSFNLATLGAHLFGAKP